MKKIILSTGILLCLGMAGIAQTNPAYDAALRKFQAFYNQLQVDSIYGMLSDRGKSMMTKDQSAGAFKGLYAQDGNLQSFQLEEMKDVIGIYKMTFEKGVLSLYMSMNPEGKLENFRFVPYQEKKAENKTPKTVPNFILNTGTGKLYGFLAVPEGDKKVPVVLILAGSGPTDMDGNSGMGLTTNAYLQLADSLEKRGIASLRYDKRGIGASSEAMKNEADIRFDDYVTDAVGMIQMLRQDKRFSKVFVLGHSEGALVGLLAAEKEKVDGYISLAGAGERIDKVIGRQLEAQQPGASKRSASIMDSIRRGIVVTDIPQQWQPLFHESVQPYLKSWMHYDPQVEIRKADAPILIVQGTTDIQVSVDDAHMLAKAAPNAKLHLVEGMNHIMKAAPADRAGNVATYTEPGLPLDKSLVPALARFIKAGM